MKQKILDTNILLDYPNIIDEYENLVIPLGVLKEIDGLKLNINADTAKKARRAAVVIWRNKDKINFDTSENAGSVDEQALKTAAKQNGTLITNDVALKIQAIAQNVDVKGYSKKSNYTGVHYMPPLKDMEEYNEITSELCTSGIYRNKENYSFSINEYLVVPSFWDEKHLIFKFNGEKFIPIRPRPIENNWFGEIFPKNVEQECLVESLLSDASIIYVGGGYGCGKSYLTHNYAIGELERERIKKIIYIPNNSYVQNSMELGYLPGTLLEKSIPLLGTLIDLVGIDQVERWIMQEKLEVVPLSFIRGRNFDESIVIVNEAENLMEEHVKLILGRCGKNTRIFFDGDFKQADSEIFKNKNGLNLLLKLHNSPFAGIFSTVFLNKIERSEVARAADYLDKV